MVRTRAVTSTSIKSCIARLDCGISICPAVSVPGWVCHKVVAGSQELLILRIYMALAGPALGVERLPVRGVGFEYKVSLADAIGILVGKVDMSNWKEDRTMARAPPMVQVSAPNSGVLGPALSSVLLAVPIYSNSKGL